MGSTLRRGRDARSLHRSRGAVRQGELIRIDIPARRLELLVPDEEIARRLAERCPRPLRTEGGFMDVYRRIVSGADEGAVLGT